MIKRLSILALAALAVSSCVNDSPLLVTGIFSLDPNNKGECAATDVAQGGGSLDVSGGAPYQMVVALKNDLDATINTETGGRALIDGVHRNTVVLEEIAYTYTATNLTLEREIVPVALVVAPATLSNIRMSLLGSKAAERLAAGVAVGQTVDVKVRLEFRGSIVSGGKLTSFPISFPITVYNSGFAGCPTAGDTVGRTGPCGAVGGQDGAPLCCTSNPTCKTL